MKSQNHVEAAYQRFLERRLGPATALELHRALAGRKLLNEAAGIRAYAENGEGAQFVLQDGPFSGKACIAASVPPTPMTTGQVWFDVVELCTMVLVPGRIITDATMASWIRTRPVCAFQFRVFMTMVQWRLRNNPFLRAGDLMKQNRVRELDELDVVTNVYHEEAVAYAHWFGKTLVGAHEFRRAEASLSAEAFFAMLPPGLRLWSENAPSDSEFVRMAIGVSSLHKDPDDEVNLRETGENVGLADRLLFEEWDADGTIGLSTKLTSSIGLLRQLPMRAFDFMELENVAYRPG